MSVYQKLKMIKATRVSSRRVTRTMTNANYLLLSDEECMSRFKTKVAESTGVTYLKKDGVIDWCFPGSQFVTNLTSDTEKAWGQSTIGYNTNQWTTKLGECILQEVLFLRGKNPKRINNKQRGENGKNLIPDFETSAGLYECKARTYRTTGTAGEKVLGTPWKYSDCYRLYGKPVFIVCMAYQEQEADDDFCVFKTTSDVRKKMLECFEKEAGIKFIKFTNLIKELIG